MLPLMGADMQRMNFLRPQVQQLVKNSKIKVKLVKFSNREELEEFNP